MKNLAHLLAVPISEHELTFISLVAAATLLSRTSGKQPDTNITQATVFSSAPCFLPRCSTSLIRRAKYELVYCPLSPILFNTKMRGIVRHEISFSNFVVTPQYLLLLSFSLRDARCKRQTRKHVLVLFTSLLFYFSLEVHRSISYVFLCK